jgi:hypothetical protein
MLMLMIKEPNDDVSRGLIGMHSLRHSKSLAKDKYLHVSENLEIFMICFDISNSSE